ncbi:MAG TPA: hypothetical protein GX707_19810 [Epulopiscium sp.]|nr:hypothetical protein [Candidatus Epulonipiscium sp.]
MKQMIISTYSYRLQIEEYINKRLEELKLKEYKPSIKVEQIGKTTFITCSFSMAIPKSKEQRYFEEYIIRPVAKAMVDIIKKEFAIEYANEVLQTNYAYKEILITGMAENELELKSLLDPLMNEMMENSTFCLDGWIRFRLSKYKLYMIDMVDNLTCEYEAYKEYEEFIALLKSFILDQQSLMEQIHIIPSYNGVIELYNEKKEHMTLDIAQYNCYDDLILGTLLTLAPLNMTIHKEEKCKNIRLINTIKSIYDGKVTFCKGCKYCEKLGFKVGFIRALKDILTQKKL